MAKNLPGFYYDSLKNRYFPISSRASSTFPADHTESPKVQRQDKLQSIQRNALRSLHKLSSEVPGYNERDRRHVLQLVQVGNTSSKIPLHPPPRLGRADITSFDVTDLDSVGEFTALGDSYGRVFCKSGDNLWNQDHVLTSQITSVCISGDKYMATSFGPSPQIMLGSFTLDMNTTLSFNNLSDVWIAELKGSAAVFGARGHAVYVKNIEYPEGLERLNTRSDVLALNLRRDSLIAGTRNGALHLFDLRTSQRYETLGSSSQCRRSSITHLEYVDDWNIIASSMSGTLELFDARYLCQKDVPQVLMSFQGHVNAHTHRLGLYVDRSNHVIFAAGHDRRVRAWSILTGQVVLPNSTVSGGQGLFSRIFESPVINMRSVVSTQQTSLRIATCQNLYGFNIGDYGF